MKLECIHGYFKFEEVMAGQLSYFMNLYGLELERQEDHFTFSDLVDAPDYSLPGGTFLGAPTLYAFEGPPCEVMRKNRLVYNFQLGLVVPIDTVIQPVSISQSGFFFVSTGMILPGSVTDDGSRVTDYSAFFIPDRQNFKYSEIDYE